MHEMQRVRGKEYWIIVEARSSRKKIWVRSQNKIRVNYLAGPKSVGNDEKAWKVWLT